MGAARAAVLPPQIEHKVVDDKLPAPLEQVAQACLAGRSLEDVILVDFYHRQPATLGVYRVARTSDFLLFREQRFASRKPRVARDDWRESSVAHKKSSLSGY